MKLCVMGSTNPEPQIAQIFTDDFKVIDHSELRTLELQNLYRFPNFINQKINSLKQILLVRHAKSSWDDPSLADFDRPLNDRGVTDAPAMAKKIKDRKVKLDALITSPAKRAKQTCKYFAKELDIKKKKMVEEKELYEAMPDNFLNVIDNLKNKWDNIAIFSHNPGISSFANSLTNTRIDDMPTCSVFAVTADVKKWEDFREAKKEFWFFDYPKNA